MTCLNSLYIVRAIYIARASTCLLTQKSHKVDFHYMESTKSPKVFKISYSIVDLDTGEVFISHHVAKEFFNGSIADGQNWLLKVVDSLCRGLRKHNLRLQLEFREDIPLRTPDFFA